MNRIYWDHNATTPLHPEIRKKLNALEEQNVFGNPSSIHWAGREARRLLNMARESIAAQLCCDESEIIFTSGGTESINLALSGIWQAHSSEYQTVISSRLEHPATLKTLQFLERSGTSILWLDHDSQGRLNLEHLKILLAEKPLLVSLMAANNELGNLNPIAAIADLCQAHQVFFHCDATQWMGKLALDFKAIPIDLLSFSSHKFHGPKGSGALILKKGTRLIPLHHGGGQEGSLRAGTQNVLGIYGMALALEEALINLEEKKAWVLKLRNQFEKEISANISGVNFNGDLDQRLYNTSNVSFEGVEAQSLLMNLDLQGIAASSGSACESGSIDPSHVLLALGHPLQRIKNSIRVSFSALNTELEMERGIQLLIQTLQRLKKELP